MSIYCKSGNMRKVLYALLGLIQNPLRKIVLLLVLFPFYRWGSFIPKFFEIKNYNGAKICFCKRTF